MSLPEQLLLSDLLARRVRCDRGLEHGAGQLGWMHPPVHRLLGWASRPSALSSRRCVWRLDQLRGLTEGEVLVQGEPADTDAETLERLPTLLGAMLLSGGGEPIGQLADAAVELRSGRILHYLVARSDPRLPGGSRWRLSPDRIVDQRPGEVSTALQGLADLPLARASLRETLLRRSRRWRDQWDEETSRLRDQWQQASGRFEQRLEGWLEESPWEESSRSQPDARFDRDIWPEEDAQPWADAARPPEGPLSPSGLDAEEDGHRGGFGSSRSTGDSKEPWLDADQARSARIGQERGGRSRPPARVPQPEPWDALDADPDAAWDAADRDLPPLVADEDGRDPRSVPLQARRGRPPQPPEDQDDPWV